MTRTPPPTTWQAQATALRDPDTALIDSRSKEQYGIPKTLEGLRRQRGAELADRSIRLVGTFPMGTDFANDGNLIMSTANLVKFFPYRAGRDDPLSSVDLGIVRARPGADLRAVQQALVDCLDDTEVAVYLKQELIDKELRFWDRSTPIGYIFSVGTIMALWSASSSATRSSTPTWPITWPSSPR